MAHTRPLFHLFTWFQTLKFLQQINVKKCPSSRRCWDSNPQPLEQESLPITTRPGLPPQKVSVSGQSQKQFTIVIYDSVANLIKPLRS